MTTLYFKEGSSDKVYQAWLEDSTTINMYDVVFAYGRRGSTMAAGKKNTAPLTKEEASKMLMKLLREKMAKGYTEGEDGAAYKATDKEDRFTGILPMLLNAIDESEVKKYIRDDNWVAQEKFDGIRMMLRKNLDGTVDAINRKGLLVGAPQVILDEVATLAGTFILDGECVGDMYHAFDLILEDVDLDHREDKLFDLLHYKELPHILKVSSSYTPYSKSMLLDFKKKNGAEGIVLKNVKALYTPGRPASGGNALKFKFYKTASVVVHRVNTQRSVNMVVWRENQYDQHNGEWVDCGNVTIPANQDIPTVGDVIEVRYLYANRQSGHLYQPVYLGKRTDIYQMECVASQLKFKNENEEDES